MFHSTFCHQIFAYKFPEPVNRPPCKDMKEFHIFTGWLNVMINPYCVVIQEIGYNDKRYTGIKKSHPIKNFHR